MLTKDQEHQVRKIRAEYVGKHPALQKLWDLDAKVKDPAIETGWVCVVLGVLFVGLKMIVESGDGVYYDPSVDAYYTWVSAFGFDLKVDHMIYEIIAPVLEFLGSFVGPVLVLGAYPIYRWILKSRKQKYGHEILKLTKELLDD